ncbi:hypothetical protein JGU65_27505 [Bacillus sp. T_4]|nr:hypothetical protein [Bacillus sp. S34]MBZ5482919.1 hypothetical protein [Bacillus sp. T_4]
MKLILGIILILWGTIIVYSSFFRFNKKNYKNNVPIGTSGYIEMEFLFKIFNKLPWAIVRFFIVFIGIAFVTIGFSVL